jgi:hypothetical protein
MEVFHYFHATEEITKDKNRLLETMEPVVDGYTDFFKYAQRSKLRNPDKRKTTRTLTAKRKLHQYTTDALLFLLLSFSLIENTNNLHQVMLPVIMSNYSTSSHPLDEEDAERLITNLEVFSKDNENFLSFKNKMCKHVEGMLLTHQLKEVMDIYRTHLTPRFYEKKNLGQVFTPFSMIDDILDQIPIEVMTDPNSTFLDPSAGMGGFLVVLYKRLMTSLAKKIPNKKKRHVHIITNMLYAAEITKNNVALMRKIFGDGLHIYCGDSRFMDLKKDLHIMNGKVTVLIGNPPFEKQQKKEVAKQGGHNLWTEFVELSLTKWLLPDGYFGMVLPPGWRKAMDDKSRSSGLWKLMTVQTTPCWVVMYDTKETKKIFNDAVTIRVDLVVIKNTKNKGFKTIIRDTDGKIFSYNLQKLPFLPNANLNKYWRHVLTNKEKDAIGVMNSSFYHSTRDDRVSRKKQGTFKHKVIHAIHADGDPVYLYVNQRDKKGGFGVSKLIFNGYGGWNQPILDLEGKYGMSEVVFGIPVASTEEGREMFRFFQNQKVMEHFQNDMNWSTSRPKIFWNMFQNIKKDFYQS